ncbi:Meiotically up-regulated 89 [Hyphodiscus hymeniophilus]|uniref:Meiotically up-regulated 89 n=1 Tax=Hyphodiscus hymeniophilus TaxID=353542 RepID=A0A9P7AZT8_9HELO|nr:Meiotically up-regulated 89 [Hyphodiscus hymeniophilus]
MADEQPPMGHEDSIDSQDPNQKDGKTKQKSRRPANTAFRQQRLKAWQPILTPKTVLPLFFAIGVIFAPIGGLLLYASAQVQEITLDYTHCWNQAPVFPATATMPSHLVTMHFKKNSSRTDKPDPPTWSRKTVNATFGNATSGAVHAVVENTTQCVLTFPVPSRLDPPVLFYYRLTNFYQNHRRYAKSFDNDQLSGKAVSASTIHGSDCTPLTTVTVNGTRLPYYPCGLAANSVFNDTFSSPVLLDVSDSNEPNRTYVMQNNSDIAWSSDKKLYGQSSYKWSDVVVPPNWVLRYPNNYSDEYHPDLVNDEPFQVWMRLAGLPTFSKLAQRNDDTPMDAGTYSVEINHHFNVTDYGGTKSIVISTRTVTGGKNPFLGIAYVVVAGICVVLGTLFTITHLIRPRKLGDHTYLTWNNNQAPTATTSGRDNMLGAESGRSGA